MFDFSKDPCKELNLDSDLFVCLQTAHLEVPFLAPRLWWAILITSLQPTQIPGSWKYGPISLGVHSF